jgi:hypothetical protein
MLRILRKSIMLAAVYREDASPEVPDHMITAVFDADEEEIPFAFLCRVPIAARPRHWEIFVKKDGVARLLAAEHGLDVDLALEDRPIAALCAGWVQKQPVLILLLLDDPDEDMVGAREHLIARHIHRVIENQPGAAAGQGEGGDCEETAHLIETPAALGRFLENASTGASTRHAGVRAPRVCGSARP